MRRHQFIGLVGSAAAGWPVRLGAQTRERLIKIGQIEFRHAVQQSPSPDRERPRDRDPADPPRPRR